MTSKKESLLKSNLIFIIFCFITAYFAYHNHFTQAMSLYNFNDDVRQHIVPLLKLWNGTLFPNDYIIDAYLHTYMGVGYKGLYCLCSFFLNPITISHILPYILIFLFAVSIAYAVKPIGGEPAMYAVVFLIFFNDTFFYRSCGGLPRAFGYPIIGLLLFSVMNNKPLLLSVVTIIGAGFYPMAAMISYFSYIVFMLLPEKLGGFILNSDYKKRAFYIFITTTLLFFVLIPHIYGVQLYGGQTPLNFEQFPELALEGRLSGGFMNNYREAPLKYIESFVEFGNNFISSSPFRIVLSTVSVFYLVLSFFTSVYSRKLFLFTFICFVLHFISAYFQPLFYVPKRYIVLSVPVIFLFLLSFIISATNNFLLLITKRDNSVTITSTIVFLLVFNYLTPQSHRINNLSGLNINIQKEEAEVLNFISSLSKSSLIAGWPGTVIENIPYVSKKSVLFSYEAGGLGLFVKPALEIRRRTYAFIDAYFATDLQQIKRLKNEYGVNYLIVYKSHIENPPDIYSPFNKMLKSVWEEKEITKKPFIVNKLKSTFSVFENKDLFILDLNKI